MPEDTLDSSNRMGVGVNVSSLSNRVTPIAGLEEEMQSILRDVSLDAREKSSLYYQLLQRYFRHGEEERRPFTTLNAYKSYDPTVVRAEGLQDDQILDIIPTTCCKKASALLSWIKQSNIIRWDQTGATSINGVKLDNSNIADLVRDLMTERNVPPPPGSREFITSLKKLNVPVSLIGNPSRWETQTPFSTHPSPGIVTTTAKHLARKVSQISTSRRTPLATPVRRTSQTPPTASSLGIVQFYHLSMPPKPQPARKLLENLYYNLRNPSAFAGVQPLKKASGYAVSRGKIKNWLASQDTYTLFKPVRKKFRRNPYLVSNINDLWQADLVDTQRLKEDNDNVSYLLTVIDVFSKKAYIQPLINKTPNIVIEGFRKIFDENAQKPYKLQTDKGSEFVAASVKKFFAENDIDNFTTQNDDVKAAVIERFNRTLKTRMYKFLYRRNSTRYLDDLQSIVNAYNCSYHRSIKMSPNEVTDDNILQVYRNLYDQRREAKTRKPKLKVDDHVRLAKRKDVFEKGYTMTYTEEIFKVIKVIRHPIPVYRVADLNDKPLAGKFYDHELQKVHYDPNAEFVVEEIIKIKGKGKNAQYFVKWRGYPSSFNSWIPSENLRHL